MQTHLNLLRNSFLHTFLSNNKALVQIDNVQIGTNALITAQITQNNQTLYEGKSEIFTVSEGKNQVKIQLKKLSAPFYIGFLITKTVFLLTISIPLLITNILIQENNLISRIFILYVRVFVCLH